MDIMFLLRSRSNRDQMRQICLILSHRGQRGEGQGQGEGKRGALEFAYDFPAWGLWRRRIEGQC